MKGNYSKFSVWLIVIGIVIGLGQYLTPIYNSTILIIGVSVYMIGFILGIIAIVKREKGLAKYVSPVSFVVIPAFIFFAMLWFALHFGEK